MIKIFAKQISNDGSVKLALQDEEANQFEAIGFKFIENNKDEQRPFFNYYKQNDQFPKCTICISSQCGCAMGCKFCATGYGGFFKNLNSDQMERQLIIMREELIKAGNLKEEDLINVILMGMGEPLMNYNKVIQFCHNIKKWEKVLSLVSISTIGIIPQIQKLSLEGDLKIKLFLSLHSPFDSERTELMPINERYPIQPLLKTCEEYSIVRQDKIIVTYLLIKNKNDSLKHAKVFASLLNPAYFEVQLLLYNPIKGIDFERPESEKVLEFLNIVKKQGLTVDIRVSKGQDIDGGCGQLIRNIFGKTMKKSMKQKLTIQK